MVEENEVLAAARGAHRRRDWVAARDRFAAADGSDPAGLSADDLYALAEAAWWLGDMDGSLQAYERAYRAFLADDRPCRAAMAAMFLAERSIERGDAAIGSGWMSRVHRLLRDQPEGPEHGYPIYFEIFAAMGRGDLIGAGDLARRMQDVGRRFADPNLVAIGVLGEGRTLVKQGLVDDGMALLDEAMLAALADDLHPAWTGAIYCHLMDVCHQLGDVRRAAQWTQASRAWCDEQPSAVMYRGICQVHRAQLLQVQGAWDEAEREAAGACVDLLGVHVVTAAEGHYEVGEIRRLRGDLAGAEEAFRRAHELGRDPQPGLALLRLAQGRVEAAASTVRAALTDDGLDALERARLRAVHVDVALAAGDTAEARAACDELRATAEAYGTSGLTAAAGRAHGAVLLAEDRAAEALPILRGACRLWQEIDAPYDAATTRLRLADAYCALGDDDAAALELDAAHDAFDRLGAALDARRVDERRGRRPLPGGLTEREAEVLRLVAAGRTNRDVAAELFISEKTVARHLSNIFAKLGLSSRTAATAYAFEHRLAAPAPPAT